MYERTFENICSALCICPIILNDAFPCVYSQNYGYGYPASKHEFSKITSVCTYPRCPLAEHIIFYDARTYLGLGSPIIANKINVYKL